MNLSIVILGFLASLLTVFALCVAISRKVEQTRDNLKAWEARKKTQQEIAEAAAHSSWRGNKEMIMH